MAHFSQHKKELLFNLFFLTLALYLRWIGVQVILAWALFCLVSFRFVKLQADYCNSIINGSAGDKTISPTGKKSMVQEIAYTCQMIISRSQIEKPTIDKRMRKSRTLSKETESLRLIRKRRDSFPPILKRSCAQRQSKRRDSNSSKISLTSKPVTQVLTESFQKPSPTRRLSNPYLPKHDAEVFRSFANCVKPMQRPAAEQSQPISQGNENLISAFLRLEQAVGETIGVEHLNAYTESNGDSSTTCATYSDLDRSLRRLEELFEELYGVCKS
ncbi:2377_t:CDS:1 [Paraglomus brasilianum]|uniref:2377_t:CDS:1 n=1 Tax=Paraglomus brasilianum TaxID=144538 RepID=A0A9N9BCI1_9GLOM|nr:2377_t:CDS:1 [Paraglomus brasilianum]